MKRLFDISICYHFKYRFFIIHTVSVNVWTYVFKSILKAQMKLLWRPLFCTRLLGTCTCKSKNVCKNVRIYVMANLNQIIQFCENLTNGVQLSLKLYLLDVYSHPNKRRIWKFSSARQKLIEMFSFKVWNFSTYFWSLLKSDLKKSQ